MSFTFAYDIAPPIMLLTVSFQVLDDPNAKVKVPPHVVENPSSNVKVEVPPPIVAPLVIATPFENPSGNVKSEVPYVDTNVETFKKASRPYQAFRRPGSGLKSKLMTDRKPDLGLQKNWQARLRPYKA
ncbi:hypothetical protein MTR_1g042790 [Medicago truncatula]|uniref:Uncharacterized protein n=1 Tax=Medicago truncatula TaxID=3880 RepID=G7I4N3_MEDTR|nr:hypothetical protein MTR_1g042790 [Medicago truncatula]